MRDNDYLNLGCGSRYHPDWTNIDIQARGAGVLRHDLGKGIPLPDERCAVVYHAAVLEHLRLRDAKPFLRECHRVLKPTGIIRVGVPDLESLCRLYLNRLEAAAAGDQSAAHDHTWLMLELYDQCAREQSGGAIIDYLRQNPLPNKDFVLERIGEEGRALLDTLQGRTADTDFKSQFRNLGRPLYTRLRRLSSDIRDALLRLFIGSQGVKALRIGLFRLSGEVHHWAYDRYSLGKLLQECGFKNPMVQSAHESLIPGWNTFHLDTLPDGTVVKPDLFFMEARK